MISGVNRSVDVAVVGLGVHGAALVAELAGRGADVIGIERSAPGEVIGASHGLIRMVQARGPRGALDKAAVDALVRSWADMLIHTDDPKMLVRRRAITLDALAAVLPGTGPSPIVGADWSTSGEDPGYLLHATRAVLALRALAIRRGARLLHNESVMYSSLLRRHNDQILIYTRQGPIGARAMVFCVGPDSVNLPPSLRPTEIRIEPALSLIAPAPRHPVHDSDAYYLIHRPEGEFGILPVPGTDLVQAGYFRHLFGRGSHSSDDATARAGRSALAHHLGRRFPRDSVRSSLAHYTYAGSGDFELVRAGHRFSALSACSGTGFKFAPVVAKAVTDVLLCGVASPDLLRIDYRQADPAT